MTAANIHTVDLTLRLAPIYRNRPDAYQRALINTALVKSQRVRIGFDDADGLDESIQYIEHAYLPLRIRHHGGGRAHNYAWNLWAAIDNFSAAGQNLRSALEAWHAERGTTPIVDFSRRTVMWFAEGDERPPLGVASYPNPTGRDASERNCTFVEPRFERGKGLAGLRSFGRESRDPILNRLCEALRDVTAIMAKAGLA
jgi:hypothetical protein